MTNNIERKIEEMLIRNSKEYECSISETKQILIGEWGKGGDRGYGIFVCTETELQHIEKIDELEVYVDDLEAAKQAEKDGIKLIPFEENPKTYPYNSCMFLDTPQNRKALKKIKDAN